MKDSYKVGQCLVCKIVQEKPVAKFVENTTSFPPWDFSWTFDCLWELLHFCVLYPTGRTHKAWAEDTQALFWFSYQYLALYNPCVFPSLICSMGWFLRPELTGFGAEASLWQWLMQEAESTIWFEGPTVSHSLISDMFVSCSRQFHQSKWLCSVTFII